MLFSHKVALQPQGGPSEPSKALAAFFLKLGENMAVAQAT